jgi:hypothetical protein
MAVDGLWSIEFLPDSAGEWWPGGVAMLQGARAYGGDSAYYITGALTADANDAVNAKVQVRIHRETVFGQPVGNIWGGPERDYAAEIVLTRDGDVLAGVMRRAGIDREIPVRLTFQSALT